MKRLLFFVIGIAMTSLAMSQTASPELVSSAGDSFNNTSYQLDWSMGECVTATHSGGSYVITQGFHQNTYVVMTVENLRADINMSVFPNPTTDLVTIDFPSSEGYGNVKISVTDFSGKVLQTENFAGDIEQINFLNYAVGVYFISVLENNQLIKSFKIIKN